MTSKCKKHPFKHVLVCIHEMNVILCVRRYGDVWRSMNVCMPSSSLAVWPTYLVDALSTKVLYQTSTPHCLPLMQTQWQSPQDEEPPQCCVESGPPLQAFASYTHAVFLLIILHLWTWMTCMTCSPMSECSSCFFWGDLSIHNHIKSYFPQNDATAANCSCSRPHTFHHLARYCWSPQAPVLKKHLLFGEPLAPLSHPSYIYQRRINMYIYI